MRDFIERWYGDDCPVWTWPVTMSAACLLILLIARALQ